MQHNRRIIITRTSNVKKYFLKNDINMFVIVLQIIDHKHEYVMIMSTDLCWLLRFDCMCKKAKEREESFSENKADKKKSLIRQQRYYIITTASLGGIDLFIELVKNLTI